MDVNDPDYCRLLRYINLPPQWIEDSGSGFDTFLIEGLPVPRNQPQSRPGDPLRAVPVEGTRLGPGALPLSDGPLLRLLALTAGIRPTSTVSGVRPSNSGLTTTSASSWLDHAGDGSQREQTCLSMMAMTQSRRGRRCGSRKWAKRTWMRRNKRFSQPNSCAPIR
jgi:hypothetical protein